MQQLYLTGTKGGDALVSLRQSQSELDWEERARMFADQQLLEAIAGQPPVDGELARFRPAANWLYEASLLSLIDTTLTPIPDLTRLGITELEIRTEALAASRSLWLMSYYSDAEGTQLLSRNYLRLTGTYALSLATGVYSPTLTIAVRQPALEHAVIYAPVTTTTCWLELRLAVARGNQQRVLTADTSGFTRQLFPLVLDTATATYQPQQTGTTYTFTELRALRSRNPLAPVLQAPVSLTQVRYQTATGAGYLPIANDANFRPTTI